MVKILCDPDAETAPALTLDTFIGSLEEVFEEICDRCDIEHPVSLEGGPVLSRMVFLLGALGTEESIRLEVAHEMMDHELRRGIPLDRLMAYLLDGTPLSRIDR